MSGGNKRLVMYHYYEKDDSYVGNLIHFLGFGYSLDMDYIIIVAGGTELELPEVPNIRYVFVENKNNDYGGYAHVIRSGVDLSGYDCFFFINSSVRGPYIPAYCDKRWDAIFTGLMIDDVGLVGSTINILSAESPHSQDYKERHGGREPFSHVQTMAYAMRKEVLFYLIESGFYDIEEEMTKQEVIADYEILLSQRVLAGGWNMRCLLPEYNGIDYRYPHKDINPTSASGDPCFGPTYCGRTVHPFEALFVKTNRGMYNLEYLDKLAYSMAACTNPPDGAVEMPA